MPARRGLVVIRRLRVIGHDRGGDAEVAGPDQPHVQIRHAVVALFESLPDGVGTLRIGHHVEQHCAG